MLYKLEEVNTSHIQIVSLKQNDDDVSIFFVHVARKKLKRSKNTLKKKFTSRTIRTWHERLGHAHLRAVREALQAQEYEIELSEDDLDDASE
jgi:hypothetical protein